jgi:polyisoprenoid-binding protein YceI
VGFALHALGGPIRGSFQEFAAEFEHPRGAGVLASLCAQTASLSTGDRRLDGYLLGSGMLDAERFPQITFRSRRIQARDDASFRVPGTLTVRDISRDVSFHARIQAGPRQESGFALSVALDAELDRRTFGIDLPWRVEMFGVAIPHHVRLWAELLALPADSTAAIAA